MSYVCVVCCCHMCVLYVVVRTTSLASPLLFIVLPCVPPLFFLFTFSFCLVCVSFICVCVCVVCSSSSRAPPLARCHSFARTQTSSCARPLVLSLVRSLRYLSPFLVVEQGQRNAGVQWAQRARLECLVYSPPPRLHTICLVLFRLYILFCLA